MRSDAYQSSTDIIMGLVGFRYFSADFGKTVLLNEGLANSAGSSRLSSSSSDVRTILTCAVLSIELIIEPTCRFVGRGIGFPSTADSDVLFQSNRAVKNGTAFVWVRIA